MNSLFPVDVSSLFVVAVVIFSYFFYYLSTKKKFFAIWTVAWSLYVLRLICLLLPFIIPIDTNNSFLSLSNRLINIISSTLILYGFYSLYNKKFSNIWFIFCGIISFYLILITVFDALNSWIFLSLHVSVFTGWVHIWNGIFYFSNKNIKTKSTFFISTLFLLWGIHTIHYSIDLFFMPSFMPWFYVIDVTLVVIILIGILFEYFNDIQNRLNASEENCNLLLDNSEEAIVIARDGIIISFNTRAEDVSGYKKNELLMKTFDDLLYHEDRYEAIERHLKRQQGGEISKFNTFRIITRSGEIKWLESNATVFSMNGKKATLNFLRDITDKKKAEEDLYESKRRLFTLMSNLPGMAYRCKNNHDRTMEFVSDGFLELTGYSPEEIINNCKLSYANIIHSEDRERVWNHIQSALSEGKSFELIYRIICATGKEKWVWEKGQIVMDNDNIIALEGFISDITKLKDTETALMQSLIKFEKTFQANPVWITLSTLDEGRYIEANESFLKEIGYRQEEVIDKTWQELDTWVDPEQRANIISQLKENGRVLNQEVKRKNKKGDIINTLFSSETLVLEDNELMVSVSQNITALKKVQKDRDSLNEQLRHSQKMESIGRLAGGVAHDYNNMLTVIIINAEVLLNKMKPSSPYYKNINEILNAAERSANITKQLLVFARKEAISPEVLNINLTLDGMLKMLKRLIGEDIDLIWNPGRELWPVKVDQSQIDQILVNLSVNSRDAIESLGKITIETENVTIDKVLSEKTTGLKPGEYVLLTFSDNGKGMDTEVQKNIFEPFFTTKDIGKGTGLGLSTVYGIVKQNNGFIDVISNPDEGTAFKIYIPRHEINSEKTYIEPDNKGIESEGETILVVEDDVSVKSATEKILSGLGYNVLSTENPKEALDIVEQNSDSIHLLLSDVIMPEMSGRDMAKKITGMFPNIKILFMSGYTSDSIIKEGLVYQGANYIEKPFTTEKLGLKVREVLNEK